uniref:Uncharacterized protein n=1 Tax=Anguilla anguilla TaxID=7936 RepID=A0A0E9W8S4_ANGAN
MSSLVFPDMPCQRTSFQIGCQNVITWLFLRFSLYLGRRHSLQTPRPRMHCPQNEL